MERNPDDWYGPNYHYGILDTWENGSPFKKEEGMDEAYFLDGNFEFPVGGDSDLDCVAIVYRIKQWQKFNEGKMYQYDCDKVTRPFVCEYTKND